MGALIEHAIESASQALIDQDVNAAAKAIAFDQEVDQKERDIEALCMKLLLKQQPVARDLRLISAALKMITDMERIGDQAPAGDRHVAYQRQQQAAELGGEAQGLVAFLAGDRRMPQRKVDAAAQLDLEVDRVLLATGHRVELLQKARFVLGA